MAIVALLQKATNGEYNPDYSPATYFLQMIKGYALNTHRNNKTRAAVPIQSDDEDASMEPPAATRTPFEMLADQTEIISRIRQAFQGNISLDCTLDVMLELDGDSGLAHQVADYLGVSLQAAYNNINRVREIAAREML